MASKRKGVLDRPIAETPLAIFDFETTGLNAGVDRVVELSVIRIDPGKEPKLVLDTIVNPNRKMAATEIHGITDEDVQDAPRFEEVAGSFLRAFYDCVISSYNIYFDISFLQYELGRLGFQELPPHLCLMYMRPLLGLGSRCCLEEACVQHGFTHPNAHQSAADVQSASKLWPIYLQAIEKRGLKCFEDLTKLKSYKFLESLMMDPIEPPAGDKLPEAKKLKSRNINLTQAAAIQAPPAVSHLDALHAYWEALKAVLSDLDVTRQEIRYLERKQKEMGLLPSDVRALHARMFGNLISKAVEDHVLNDEECATMRSLYQCLAQLGWAPGQ
jgi:DNA polymerase-3 subunit epsilon